MKKIIITTTSKKLLSDFYTPVGIYLRLRDRFRDSILMESSDHQAEGGTFSYIGINAIAGIEMRDEHKIEIKYPLMDPQKETNVKGQKIEDRLWKFMNDFEFQNTTSDVAMAQGLYGYFAYDSVQLFEKITFRDRKEDLSNAIPIIRFRLYQYVIAINHTNNELTLIENHVKGLQSKADVLLKWIQSKDVPYYLFKKIEEESSPVSDEEFLDMVANGIDHCAKGDVFQVVVSRPFLQKFRGDDFNVYRSLRNINPSPYLFYFDYGDYHLFGSSPESQLLIDEDKALVQPIAGTYRRNGNRAIDAQLAGQLLNDKKEQSEHIMLVDLARNDLSRIGSDVQVTRFSEIKYFSHVIHVESSVQANLTSGHNPFSAIAATFPAGTLSGAPKYRAMEIIDKEEGSLRSYYGGSIGFVGFNGSVKQAIMIRTFLGKNNCLTYRAGAGVTISSDPNRELQEVNNKLYALTKAVEAAQTL